MCKTEKTGSKNITMICDGKYQKKAIKIMESSCLGRGVRGFMPSIIVFSLQVCKTTRLNK